MRHILMIAAALAIATPATAQTVLAAPKYDPAPWWMDQPIIASTGMVQAYIQANRASFSASFQGLDSNQTAATNKAAAKVKALSAQLAAFGADRVRVQTTFSMRPIYEQYRDKDGNLIANQRADKIDTYEVNANVSVEVRDVSLVERAYSAVLAAQPSSTQQVIFRLEAENETKTQLYAQATADAARRAREAAAAVGAKLGAVKLIDPSGRACQTDVLVGGAPRGAVPGLPQTVQVSGGAAAAPPPPAPPAPLPAAGQAARAGLVLLDGGRASAQQMQTPTDLPLQPPLQVMNQTVCVVYSLG
ncbi:MAG: hypothetical protein JWM33_2634 [Caulobacteraceae bacterium]|nr:hypothetical protein [Caulobacteraceae bacterium]